MSRGFSRKNCQLNTQVMDRGGSKHNEKIDIFRKTLSIFILFIFFSMGLYNIKIHMFHLCREIPAFESPQQYHLNCPSTIPSNQKGLLAPKKKNLRISLKRKESASTQTCQELNQLDYFKPSISIQDANFPQPQPLYRINKSPQSPKLDIRKNEIQRNPQNLFQRQISFTYNTVMKPQKNPIKVKTQAEICPHEQEDHLSCSPVLRKIETKTSAEQNPQIQVQDSQSKNIMQSKGLSSINTIHSLSSFKVKRAESINPFADEEDQSVVEDFDKKMLLSNYPKFPKKKSSKHS